MRNVLVLVLLFAWAPSLVGAEPATPLQEPTISAESFVVIVMDPLAAPLSCPCVAGYAQRNYEKLGDFLASRLGKPVAVFFSDSLVKATKNKTHGRADLVIGKRSVVTFDSRQMSMSLKLIADLTNKEGETTQVGYFVTPTKSPANQVADLKGYRVIFGPEESVEKHSAALELLKANGVAAPSPLETCEGCAEGVEKLLESGTMEGAAVISSYAKPLLEGCGQVKKGAIRIVGQTKPVPFISAFVADRADVDAKRIAEALAGVAEKPDLLVALESRDGFVPAKADAPAKKK